MSRNLKIIFTLSFALNLLLIGFLAGQALKPKPENPYHANLSKESHQLLKNTMHQSRKDTHEEMQSMRMHKKELEAIITQEPFNKAQFITSMHNLSTIKHNIAQKRIQKFADMMENVPAEERKVVLKRLIKPFLGKKPRHGKRPQHIEK